MRSMNPRGNGSSEIEDDGDAIYIRRMIISPTFIQMSVD